MIYDNEAGYIVTIHRSTTTPKKRVLVYAFDYKLNRYSVLYNTSFYSKWPFFEDGVLRLRERKYLVFACINKGNQIYYKLYDLQKGTFSWEIHIPESDPCRQSKDHDMPIMVGNKTKVACKIKRGVYTSFCTVYHTVPELKKRIIVLSNGIKFVDYNTAPMFVTKDGDLVQLERARALYCYPQKMNYHPISVVEKGHGRERYIVKWISDEQMILSILYTFPSTTMIGYKVYSPPLNPAIKRKEMFYTRVKIVFGYVLQEADCAYFGPRPNGILMCIGRAHPHNRKKVLIRNMDVFIPEVYY